MIMLLIAMMCEVAQVRVHITAFANWRNILLVALLSQSAFADVRLPRILSDGAILQRGATTAIWGWADEAESVTAYLSGRCIGTAVAVDGRWRIELDSIEAGGPHELRIQGKNSVTIRDVYFGDVWVASGQSNMKVTMEWVKEAYSAEIADIDAPLIRFFDVPSKYEFDRPLEGLDGGNWVRSTPESALQFSAVAFFFAEEIYQHINVPVGVITSTYDGSSAEGWMSERALEAFPHYLGVSRRYRDDDYLAQLKESDAATAELWYANIDKLDRGLRSSPPWSAAEYDDSDWARVRLPGLWANTEIGPKSGVLWFRKTFELPSFVESRPTRLVLGRIVGSDTTYLNGFQVGATAYNSVTRRYDIKPEVLRYGENTISVRVISTTRKGGFIEDKPYVLNIGDKMVDLTGLWRYRVGVGSEPLPTPQFLSHKQPLGLYNAMIAPLEAMRIKGVIWYQGESNVSRASEYARLFPALIRDWRRNWKQGDFPFIFVQLPNYGAPTSIPAESAWAELRDAQLKALSEPATAMAVTIDVGEWNDVHPVNKRAVGQRLALAARKIAYGEVELVSSGPLFHSLKSQDGKLIVTFDHTGSGLSVKGGQLQGFAVASSDGNYVWAQARVNGNTVAVWSDHLADPVSVRYGWADNPVDANLYNREGLPASPFQARIPESIGHRGKL